MEKENTVLEQEKSIDTFVSIFKQVVSINPANHVAIHETEHAIQKLYCHTSCAKTREYQKQLYLLLSSRITCILCKSKIQSICTESVTRASIYMRKLIQLAMDIGSMDERTLKRNMDLCEFCCECTSTLTKTMDRARAYIPICHLYFDVPPDNLMSLIQNGTGFGVSRSQFECKAFYFCQYIQAVNDELVFLTNSFEDTDKQQNSTYTSLINIISNLELFHIQDVPSNALYMYVLKETDPVKWMILSISLPPGLYSASEIVQLFSVNTPPGFILTYDADRICFTIMCTSYTGMYIYDPFVHDTPSVGSLLHLASMINTNEFDPNDIQNYATSITGFCG
jgi:hypothetical protein